MTFERAAVRVLDNQSICTSANIRRFILDALPGPARLPDTEAEYPTFRLRADWRGIFRSDMRALGDGMSRVDSGPTDDRDVALSPPISGSVPRTLTGHWLTAFNLVWAVAMLTALVTVTLGVDSLVKVYRMPAGQAPSEPFIQAAIVQLAPALLLIIAAMVLHRSSRKETLAALLALSFLFVAASNFMARRFWTVRDMTEWGNILDNVGWVGVFLALVIPLNGSLKPKWLWFLVVTLVALWVYEMILPALGLPDEKEVLFFPGGTILLHVATFGTGVLSMTLRYRGSFRQERQRARWLLLGFAAGTIATAIGAGLLFLRAPANPASAQTQEIVRMLFSLGVCAYVGGLLIAVQKYGLYDADAFLTRTAAYSALLVLAAGVYAIGSTALNPILERAFPRQPADLYKVGSAILVAVLVSPLRHRFEKWADRRFRSTLIDLQEQLPRDIADMREFASRDDLLEETLARIEHNMRAVRTAVLIDGVPAAMRNVRAGPVMKWIEATLPGGGAHCPAFDPSDEFFPARIPLRMRSGEAVPLLGWLLVGPREGGSLFGADEREALQRIGQPLARAIVAIGISAENKARLRSLEENVARLAARHDTASA